MELTAELTKSRNAIDLEVLHDVPASVLKNRKAAGLDNAKPYISDPRYTPGLGSMIKSLTWGLTASLKSTKTWRKRPGHGGDLTDVAASSSDSPLATEDRATEVLGTVPFLDPTFLSITPHRESPAAHRLVIVGELSPLVGTADLQSAVARWAECHPEQKVEITWIGDGDFRTVLDAQPLPVNMRQRFVGSRSGTGLAEIFCESGLLIVPDFFGRNHAPLTEATVAGLPIIGSRLNAQTKAAVVHGETGWLFDPLAAGSIFDVLDRAMETSVERLNCMRMASRLRICATPVGRGNEGTVAGTSEGSQ